MKHFRITNATKVERTVMPAFVLEAFTIDGPEEMEASDGYHTFTELYDHRISLWIALCRNFQAEFDLRTSEDEEAQKDRPVWRSRAHSDGTGYMGWFILGIYEKEGEQITYHLPESRWHETDFAETLEKAPEWDGHASADVLERLKNL